MLLKVGVAGAPKLGVGIGALKLGVGFGAEKLGVGLGALKLGVGAGVGDGKFNPPLLAPAIFSCVRPYAAIPKIAPIAM